MRSLKTTATSVEKIKKRARQLRADHPSLGAARDAAAAEAGYADYHHVTESFKATQAMQPALHPQVAAAQQHEHLSSYGLPVRAPEDQVVWGLLKGRTNPLVPVLELEIKPREKSKVLCRLQIGRRAWDLHLDHWGKLHIGMSAVNPRSSNPDDWAHGAPYADVVFIRHLDDSRPGTLPGMAMTKYDSEHIFSLRALSPPEIAEAAFQFGLFIGNRAMPGAAVPAMRASPAFKILARNLHTRARKLKPLDHPDYWDWRGAAAELEAASEAGEPTPAAAAPSLAEGAPEAGETELKVPKALKPLVALLANPLSSVDQIRAELRKHDSARLARNGWKLIQSISEDQDLGELAVKFACVRGALGPDGHTYLLPMLDGWWGSRRKQFTDEQAFRYVSFILDNKLAKPFPGLIYKACRRGWQKCATMLHAHGIYAPLKFRGYSGDTGEQERTMIELLLKIVKPPKEDLRIIRAGLKDGGEAARILDAALATGNGP